MPYFAIYMGFQACGLDMFGAIVPRLTNTHSLDNTDMHLRHIEIAFITDICQIVKQSFISNAFL